MHIQKKKFNKSEQSAQDLDADIEKKNYTFFLWCQDQRKIHKYELRSQNFEYQRSSFQCPTTIIR